MNNLNQTKVNLKYTSSGIRVFKLPEGSRYLKLHYKDEKLIALTVEYEAKKHKVNMKVDL